MGVITRRHIARMLQIHPITLDRWRKKGKVVFRVNKVNNTIYVTSDELKDLNKRLFATGHWDYREFEERNSDKNPNKDQSPTPI